MATRGYPFASADEQLKLSVWAKGKIADGYNGNFYRRDAFGSWMQYSAHGETLSHFGWEIAHIKPIEEAGLTTFRIFNHSSGRTTARKFEPLRAGPFYHSV